MGGATGASGTAHPFTGYNKKDIHGALVGNWVEERSLESATGVFRYKEWVKESEQQVDSVYAKDVGAPEGMSTYARVLEHSDRLDAGEWETSNQSVYLNPGSRTHELRVYVDPAKVGKRSTAMLMEMKAKALVPPPEPPLEKYLESTAQASYQAYDLTGVKVGAKVMKTQDYTDIPASAKDPTFQAELGLVSKATIDKSALPTVPKEKFAEDFTTAEPITVYSQKVEVGPYPNSTTIGSQVKGPNPFAKTSEFSKPISDFSKDPASLC